MSTVEYRCPGESYAISRSVHLARMAAFYPKCRDCAWADGSLQKLQTHLPISPVTGSVGNAVNPALATRSASEDVANKPISPLLHREGIRGRYLNDLDRHSAGELAGALASLLWEQRPWDLAAGAPQGPLVIVGHDERPASPDIVTGAASALRRMGCRVIDVGLATRPCLWFAVQHLQADAGLLASGSGFDPSWTGLDLVGPQHSPCSYPGLLERVVRRWLDGYTRTSRQPGSHQTFHAWKPYEAGLWKHFHALRPLRVVCACPSAMTRGLLERLFHPLACTLTLIQSPVRQSDFSAPDEPELLRVRRAVIDRGAHLGVAISDDAQRCCFVDEAGTVVSSAGLARLLEAALADGETLEAQFRALRATPGIIVSPDGQTWFCEPDPACDAVVTVAKVLQALSRSDVELSLRLAT